MAYDATAIATAGAVCCGYCCCSGAASSLLRYTSILCRRGGKIAQLENMSSGSTYWPCREAWPALFVAPFS